MSGSDTTMKYTRLGSTGMEVSRICLGCMSYGEPGRGTHPWSLDEDSSRPFFAQALDLGINFFDTANVYSLGTSEEYLGRAINSLTSRDQVVIATKVHGRMHDGPNGAGLSRRAIMTAIDDSFVALAPITSTFTKSIDGIPEPRSRRRWRPSTMWCALARRST